MDSRHDFTLEKVFWGYFGALDQKANSALLVNQVQAAILGQSRLSTKIKLAVARYY